MMIIGFTVSLKAIRDLGRSFPWTRPEVCPVCGHDRLWGHGFVWAFFDGVSGGLWLRLWRCPECGGVHRARPSGYFRRFQAAAAEIQSRLSRRILTGYWPPGVSRSRQGHWLRSLKAKVTAYLGLAFRDRLLEGFDRLISLGRIPVSRSM